MKERASICKCGHKYSQHIVKVCYARCPGHYCQCNNFTPKHKILYLIKKRNEKSL